MHAGRKWFLVPRYSLVKQELGGMQCLASATAQKLFISKKQKLNLRQM